jgi:hypothetical protein
MTHFTISPAGLRNFAAPVIAEDYDGGGAAQWLKPRKLHLPARRRPQESIAAKSIDLA